RDLPVDHAEFRSGPDRATTRSGGLAAASSPVAVAPPATTIGTGLTARRVSTASPPVAADAQRACRGPAPRANRTTPGCLELPPRSNSSATTMNHAVPQH